VSTMKDRLPESTIPPELMAELQEAVDQIMKGVRDPDAMDPAAKEMDEGREEIKRRLGELNIAVELVRETRNSTS